MVVGSAIEEAVVGVVGEFDDSRIHNGRQARLPQE
jgi:hypothetical protein